MAQSWWNNPGNIGFGNFASGYGASSSGTADSGHSVAAFPTVASGWQATYDLATNKYNGGATSLNQLIAGNGGWTPGNYTAAGNIAGYMGISPSADLNLNNPASMQSFGNALAKQEGSSWAVGNAPLPGGGTPGGGGSITQMTTAQAAAMGMNPDGTPLSSGGSPASLDKLGSSTPQGGAQGGSSGSSPGGSSGQDSSAGTPLNITDPNAIASKAGQSVQTGLGTAATAVDNLTKGLTADTTAATTAGTSWFNFLGNLLSGGTGIFARGAVGLLALVLMVAGFWFIGQQQKE